MQRKAMFPGSFDPFTRGHEAVVEVALQLFDEVVVGVHAVVEDFAEVVHAVDGGAGSVESTV